MLSVKPSGSLRARREAAHQKQIRHLLIAEGAACPVRFHDVVEIDAAIVEMARRRNSLSVLHQVALHAANLRHADQDAGAVAVAQAALDLAAIVFLADPVDLFQLLRQQPHRPAVFSLHRSRSFRRRVRSASFFLL